MAAGEAAYTAAELADAERDTLALMRAALDGRQQDIAAVLGAAGARGTRAAAERLAAQAPWLLVLLAVAIAADTPERWNQALEVDPAELLADPQFRAVIDRTMDTVQAAVVFGEA